MTDTKHIIDANEVDDATIDGATVGVSAGHGVLASMMSWVRGALARAIGPAKLVAGVKTPALDHVDPKAVTRAGDFDPTLLMGALERYSARYGSLLHGDGLLLRLGQELPPAAFPVIGHLDGFGRTLDRSSYNAKDYEDGEAAMLAISELKFDSPDNRQFIWLANAAMVRAATSMAAFVYAQPYFDVGAKDIKPRLVFEHAGVASSVYIDIETSPLSLHRHARAVIQGIWSGRLGGAQAAVADEFIESLERQGLPRDRAHSVRHRLNEAFREFKPLIKLRHSSAAFINIRAIASTCQSYAENIDRAAVRNALRHGARGLYWRNFITHLDAGAQAQIAAAEHAGALAYAHYSPELLRALNASNVNDSSAYVLTPPPGLGLGAGGGYGGPAATGEYTGVATKAFMSALDAGLAADARAVLQSLTPRYLCVVAVGHHSIPSFEKKLGTLGYNVSPVSEQMLSATAGRCLAMALNAVVAKASGKSNALPWARVLSSDTAYGLMLSPESDEQAAAGLVALIDYANAMRARGARAADVAFSLPSAEECLEAPSSNAGQALLGLHDGVRSKLTGIGARSALGLVREFLLEAAPVVTSTSQDSPAARRLTWAPSLAAVRPYFEHEADLKAGFRVALRNPNRRNGGWSLMDIHARTSPEFSDRSEPLEEDDSYTFAVRGDGTPESVDPLVFELKMPRATRFRQVIDKPARMEGWFEVGMEDISGSGLRNPHIGKPTSKAGLIEVSRQDAHAAAAMKEWAVRLRAFLAAKPFHAAALFPAVAKFLWYGGRLVDGKAIRPIGTASAFKLARACLGSSNPHGIALLCRYVTRPDWRSSTGASLLDIALEASNPMVAKGALGGLAKNSKLAGAPEALGGLVQSSIGKLMERHPQLLKSALACGAKADQTLMDACDRLHPRRMTPELQAVVNQAYMLEVINNAAKSQPPAENPAPPSRASRRVGVI